MDTHDVSIGTALDLFQILLHTQNTKIILGAQRNTISSLCHTIHSDNRVKCTSLSSVNILLLPHIVREAVARRHVRVAVGLSRSRAACPAPTSVAVVSDVARRLSHISHMHARSLTARAQKRARRDQNNSSNKSFSRLRAVLLSVRL